MQLKSIFWGNKIQSKLNFPSSKCLGVGAIQSFCINIVPGQLTYHNARFQNHSGYGELDHSAKAYTSLLRSETRLQRQRTTFTQVKIQMFFIVFPLVEILCCSLDTQLPCKYSMQIQSRLQILAVAAKVYLDYGCSYREIGVLAVTAQIEYINGCSFRE